MTPDWRHRRPSQSFIHQGILPDGVQQFPDQNHSPLESQSFIHQGILSDADLGFNYEAFAAFLDCDVESQSFIHQGILSDLISARSWRSGFSRRRNPLFIREFFRPAGSSSPSATTVYGPLSCNLRFSTFSHSHCRPALSCQRALYPGASGAYAEHCNQPLFSPLSECALTTCKIQICSSLLYRPDIACCISFATASASCFRSPFW
jgi:hypothetical protein